MREDILSLMVATRLGLSGSGELPGGLRANTGTEEKWSRGIRICGDMMVSHQLTDLSDLVSPTLAKHLLHTSWRHISHRVPRLNRPNRVFIQRKQI